MTNDPFEPIDAGRQSQPLQSKSPAWAPIVPVPPEAPPPPNHPDLGKPTARWNYRDSEGQLLGYVSRFDIGGTKQFRPQIFMQRLGSRLREWRWQSWPAPRPLYGLWDLAKRPDAPVMVAEGEKAADAASRLLPAFVVVTSPNGAKGATNADWSPLQGREVTIWPDADEPGRSYAEIVTREAIAVAALSVVVISPPADVPDGWDAADASAEGWTEARTAELVQSAKSPERRSATVLNLGQARNDQTKPADHASTGAQRQRRPPQRDTLIGCADLCELWHDENRDAYASFPVGDHSEHFAIRSRDFRRWLSGRFYQQTNHAIGGQALEDGIRVLEARAVHDGPMYQPFLRVGEHKGKLYVDLCDKLWRVVEIGPHGWKTIKNAPVKLIRTPSMRPFPEPEDGSMIEELRNFLNVSDDEFKVVVGWLVSTFRPVGPYPLLVAAGEQGSGKSVFSRMMILLTDPCAAPLRSLPREERDLIVAAMNGRVIGFDNVSILEPWLADALCRLATGGGFAARRLHTDREMITFEGQRPVLLNGIPLLTGRPDLADRSVTVRLRILVPESRDREDSLWANFDAARPRILGAIFTAVSAAVRNIDKVKLERPPRMADFASWVTAAEPGLGWNDREFLAAYSVNQHDVSESAFEADPVAVAIADFVGSLHPAPAGWEGSATDLLNAINERTPETTRKQRSWPSNGQGLGTRMDRIAPLLRSKGFRVERRRTHDGKRLVLIPPP
jgi:putative DNA primase/helicase